MVSVIGSTGVAEGTIRAFKQSDAGTQSKPGKPSSGLPADQRGSTNTLSLADAIKASLDDQKAREAAAKRQEEISAVRTDYTTGADGVRYAVPGKFKANVTPVRGDPAATIRKMDIAIRNAVSGSGGSAEDEALIRKAQRERIKAQIELSRERVQDFKAETEGNPTGFKSSILEAADAYAKSLSTRPSTGTPGAAKAV